MDNQQKEIAIYRDLSRAEIDLMNEIKQKEAELLKLINRMEARHAKELHQVENDVQCSESEVAIAALEQSHSLAEALRFTQVGKDQIQLGLMALTRAVARPTSG